MEEKITPRTKAVMVVHLYGQVARMDRILKLCRKYELRLIEDCAQSHGACFDEKMTGTFGDVGCFSFYPSKNLGGFGEGGAIVTDDMKIAEMVRVLHNYGSEKRYHNKVVGTNSRLDEIQNVGIMLPKERIQTRTVWHQYVVRTQTRDQFQEYLKENGVETIIHYPIPPHLSEAYRYLNHKPGDLPITESLAAEVLSIPMYSGMTEEEQDWVIEVINRYKGI